MMVVMVVVGYGGRLIVGGGNSGGGLQFGVDYSWWKAVFNGCDGRLFLVVVVDNCCGRLF